jgi:hypothetical protein
MAAVPLLRHQTTTVAQQVAIPPANQQHRTQAPSLFQWKKARISNFGLVMFFRRNEMGTARKIKSGLLVAACVVIGIGGVGLGLSLLPPSYSFPMKGEELERDDVITLNEFRVDMEQAIRWKPEYIEPTAIEDLALWLKQPSNENAQSISELVRVGSPEFSQVNGLINLLTMAGDTDIRGLKEKSLEDLKGDLDSRFKKLYLRDRDSALLKISKVPRYSSVLKRLKCPPFPERSGFTRWLISSVLGMRLEDRERWVKQFTESFEKQVSPTLEQYASMDRQNAIRIELDGGSFVLSKRRNSTVQDTRYLGSESTTNFDVRWSPKQEEQTDLFDLSLEETNGAGERVFDTGLRLVCLPWSQQDSTGVRVWRPQWPPQQHNVTCIAERTREFLIALGAPSEIIVTPGTTISVRDEGGAKATSLSFEVSTTEDPTWRSKFDIRFDGQSLTAVRQQVRAAFQLLNSEYITHLAGQKKIFGLPTELKKSSDNLLEGTLSHPQLGKIAVKAYLQGNLTTIWKADLSPQERERCVDQLIASSSLLEGHKEKIYLRDIEFDTTEDTIRCHFATKTLNDVQTKTQPIVMSLKKEQEKPEVTLPAKLGLLELPKDPVVAPLNSLSQSEMARQAQSHIAAKYPVLTKKYLFPRISLRGEEIDVEFDLQIEDWPILHLGPSRLKSLTEVGSAIDSLLSEENVISQSRLQWKEQGEFEHKRFGKVRGEIITWQPSIPKAIIRCELNVRNLGILLWEDHLKISNDEWSGLDDSSIADDCEENATQILASVENALNTYMPGVGLKVLPDPKGIDGVRWLSIQPFRMALRTSANADILGMKLPIRLDGIIVDRDGLHEPDEFGVDVPFSLPTPYFSVARPFIMLSYKRPALRLGGHFVPPGGLPSSWVGVFSNEASIKGYWEQRKFEGASTLTIANTPNVATGGLIADVQNQSLEGEMRGGGRLPGLPTIPARAGGRFASSRATKSLSLDSQAEILNVDVAEISLASGSTKPKVIDERLGEEENTFSVKGRLGLPSGLSMKLEGQARTDLQQYTVRGTGKLLNLTKKVRATEEAVRWENMEMTPLGPFYYDEWSASLGTLDSSVEETFDEETSLREATEDEKEYARSQFRRRSFEWGWPLQDSGTPGGEKYQSVSDLSLKVDNGNLVGIRASNSNVTEFTITSDQLPPDFSDNLKNYLRNTLCWQMTIGEGNRHLLLINPGGAYPVWHIELNGSNSVQQSQALSVPLADSTSIDTKLLKRYIDRYFMISVLNGDQMEIRSTTSQLDSPPTILSFDYVIKDLQEEISATAFFCQSDDLRMTCDLHPEILGRSSESLIDMAIASHVAPQLKTLNSIPRNFARLLYLAEDNSVFGWQLSSSRFANDGKLLLIEKNNSAAFIGEISFNAEAGLSLPDRLRRGELMLRAANMHPELRKAEVWMGRKGLLAQVGEDLFVIQSHGSTDVRIDQFKRGDFNEWNDPDTEDLLPEEWSTPQQRESLTYLDIGAKAMSREFSTAERSSNPVSWLGLLQSLGSKNKIGNE